MCNLGIQNSDRRSSSSSLVEITKEHKTDLWLSRISSFVSVVGCQVNTLCQAVCVIWITRKTILWWALLAGTTTYLSWRRNRCLANIWVFRDWCRKSAHRPIKFCLIQICLKNLTLFTHSERLSKSPFSRLVHCLAYSSTESMRILKLCFQFIDLDSRYIGPLGNTS